MEVLSFPFKLNPIECKKECTKISIGYFCNSTWTFFLTEGGCILEVSKTVHSFSVTCAFIILDISERRVKRRFRLKYIAEGEKGNVFFLCDPPIQHAKEIYGSITIIKNPPSSSKETQILISSSTSLPQLSDDLLRLLNNPDSFPDATLKLCDAEDILVHKNILSMRSPVFAAMFKNEMQEGSSGIVEIVDIEPNVLQATLKYVYSGRTDHLDDGIAGQVLFAANKYQLEELKKVCVEKLKSSMTVDNVFHIVVLGDLHDEGLKTHAKEFVCKCDKFSNLKKTEGWKMLQSENPGLAMEVVLYVVDYAQK